MLGTKPILLSAFSSGGQRHVFAASDRPTIIYSNNKKLLYSNLNENEVSDSVMQQQQVCFMICCLYKDGCCADILAHCGRIGTHEVGTHQP